jgi:hypothetical protein
MGRTGHSGSAFVATFAPTRGLDQFQLNGGAVELIAVSARPDVE